LTDKTDSWSLGIVILELLSKCSIHDSILKMKAEEEDPYYFSQSDQVDKIEAGIQWLGNLSTYDIPSIKDLYKGCLTVDRSDRWCMKTIYDKCREIAVQGINRIEKHDHMTEAWTSNSSKISSNKLTSQAMFAQNIEKDYSKAVSLFEKALDIDNSDVHTLSKYGTLLMNHIHDIDKAQEMFEKVLSIDANNVATLYSYGILLMNHRSDVDSAQVMFERALTADASHLGTLHSY